MAQTQTIPVPIGGRPFFHPAMADPNSKAHVATVPCKYKVGRILGQGTYAVVKGPPPSMKNSANEIEAVHIDTGKFYAAKVISKRLMAGREHMVRNEITVLRKISMGHENILTLVDYFETVNSRTYPVFESLSVVYLITDLCLGGELFDRICRKGNYYESDAANLVRVTASAVSYLHDHGIVHRGKTPHRLRTTKPNLEYSRC